MNKQQEPRLRFKEFAGAWEEKVLGENASFTKGSGYSKSDLTDSGFPIILYGRLYTKYENIIENVDTFVSCDKNALKSLGNEVIVPASGETAEDIARASAVYQQDVILGGDLNIITPNENIASPFLALTLTNGKSNQELAKKAQGKSVVHLRNDDLRACKISFPSFLEQTHLGLFFRRLDSQIAESRAVLEKSRQLKKAMLAKMFPVNGEKIPKIRFKGFEGGWKREILKDVVNVFDNLRIPVSENKRTSGNTPYFGANGIQDYVDGFTHNGEFVLIAEDGANDLKNYPVQYVNGKCWVNNHAHVLQGKSEILNNIFLFSRFQSMDISQFLVGGGRAKLNGSTMLEIEIEFPKDKKEQTAIGLFFRQLDETIALQSAEVEKLNQLKKGLLAAMLV